MTFYVSQTDSYRVLELSPGTSTTIAGVGYPGFAGDGGPANQASINTPYGIAIDPTGRICFGDVAGYNGRVRCVTAGIIQTIAGDGQIYDAGDGGAATAATLFNPRTMAADAAGNIYIADYDNSRLREVSGGIIATIAGTGNYYGSTGYGGPATSATLTPTSVAVGPDQTLYIADQSNLRVVRLAGGVLEPIAGNGGDGFSGDGGPATSATLSIPEGVAVDGLGNVYISDSFNNRVRKVSNGVITTVAGNGAAAFSGDGGPAASASLNFPEGIAVDGSGNLYIADQGNNRVRVVSGGTITTIAGNGAAAFTGDGGSALAASLNTPWAVAVDASGDLYIADTGNSRIRKVTGGIINTVAGNGTPGFSGDGGAATGASFNFATGVAVDNSGNLYISDYSNNRIRVVLAGAPAFLNPVSSGTLSLSGSSTGKAATASLDIAASGTAAGPILVSQMPYFVQVTSGSNWLSVSPTSGTSPGLVTVTADPSSLAPGNYSGSLVLSLANATPGQRTINVQFTVGQGVPPAVSLDQSHMSFNYATTSAARSQTLVVSNSGGGSVNFTTSIQYNSGASANWLSVAPQSGTASPGNPVSLAVTADPSQLALLGPGTYTASLTVNGGPAGSVMIPITMTITKNPLVMLLSQAGLTFTAIQNGGVIPPQTFGVLNLGSGTLNWTVQPSTLTGGNWLNAMPSSGSSTAADVNGAPLVRVSVDPAGLPPGVYYGLMKVISPGAANTPQEVVVVLQVLHAGSDLAPIVQPTSLLFSASAGVASPSSQTVAVYDPTGTSKDFQSGVATSAGGNWLVAVPADATIPATAPAEIVVQPIVNGLAPGTYTGTLTLQFSDGRVSTVGVTFVVTGTPGTTSENPHSISHDSGSCSPTKLIPVLTSLGSGFTVPAGFPEGLTAQVTDDCGNALTQGQVSVEFSTGQGLKYMQSLNNGRWDVTWQTGPQTPSVTLTVHATHPTLPITGSAQITGALGNLQAPPQVADRGVVSSASFTATPIAPGGFISIFGSLLSDATSSAQVLPLPTMLNNTTVKLGDLTLPLFYTNNGATSQLNALVPYETPLNTNQQLLVQRDNTYATPVYVNVAAAQPGVLEYGNQEAVAVDMNGNLIGPSNPAHAGDLLTMYCLGLGAVSPAVADGAAAPSNPPASTVNTVTVTVGGQTANVYFAGLTPTLAGLYQIDFYVPQNAGMGDQVPVMVSTGQQTSVAVNLSVQ